MNFGTPKLLWLLLLVPALAALVWWSFRARQRAMAQFVGSRLLASLTVGLSRTRQKVRATLLLGGVALALFSLARSQLGFDLEEAKQRGLDVVIAIDTSKSMLADDIQPNRLTRAKLAALDLMRLSKSDRLGLVAFAGSAFLQCPLSLDDEAFRQSVESLDVNIIPQGGTAIAEAIQTALSAFKEKTDNHKILVIFTDGEDNETEGDALAAAREAKKDGLRIFTIGTGTPAGELLSTTDPYGNRVFIKDDKGNVVKSRLNESLLQQLAKETDGFYLPLAGASTMDVLYERGLAPLPKSEFNAKTVRQYHERFQWFLGAALVLLLAEMFFPERVKRSIQTKPAVTTLVALLCLASLNAFGDAGDALKSYERGKFGKARDEFERLAKKKPEDTRLRYNAGAAAFQDENYEDALRHFNASLSSQDVKLQEQSYYNLGNTSFRLGERAQNPKEKQQSWEQAIHNYENALKLDPNDPDSKFNRDVVQQKLEELKKQQQQQKDQQKNDDKKDDKEKQDQQKQDDQKKDEKSDQEKNQDQQKSEQQKKDEQSKQDQQKKDQQEKQQQEKQDQSPQDQQSAQDQRGEQPDKASQAAQYNRVMQMTPQQAAQLLEAQKAEEKAMVFLPQQTTRTNKPTNRVFKDW